MGNAPAKRGQNPSRLIQTDQEPTIESIQDKIQPLAVFGLQDMTRDEILAYMRHPNLLTKRYRELLRVHHPDRGGTQFKCAVINYCYEKLKEAQTNLLSHTQQPQSRTDQELRNEYQEQKQYDEKEVAKAVQTMMQSDPGDFSKNFNEAFEMAKMKDYTDDGYEAEPRTQSTKRAHVAVKHIDGITGSNMNKMFESKTKVNTALTVHERKQPEGISSLQHAVYEYGKKKETDFGRMTKGAADYGIAFAGERLVDFEAARPKDKDLTAKVSMDAAKRARETQNLDHRMTEEERELWAEEEERREAEELERKAHMTEVAYEAGKRQNIFIERMITFSTHLKKP